MNSSLLVMLGIVVLLVFIVIGIYNGLVRLKNQVKNSWAQVSVQLKRRHDLIPNLLETVKGYMEHEKSTLENVVKLRQQAINITGDTASLAKIENQLSSTLKSLFAVAENYPDLKANQNFLALQEELASTENKISFARQNYNDSVMTYNTKIEVFPDCIIAGMFNFTKSDFFEIEEEDKEVPQVKF